MTDKTLFDKDIDFVNELVVEAGRLALKLQASSHKINQTQSDSIFISVDEKISHLLVEKLQNKFANQLIISEEALPEKFILNQNRVWVIDPIDGTDHYLANDTQYSIMIGLLVEGKPVYGWVYNPAVGALYHGGPNRGAWVCDEKGKSKNIVIDSLAAQKPVRVILGRRDIKNNSWLENLSDVKIMQVGSIGYKIGKIFENEADVLMHLAGRLKIWDTAGPVAVAMGAGLEVGGEEIDELIYSQDSFVHSFAIVMGKKGSLDWFRSKIIPSWIQ